MTLAALVLVPVVTGLLAWLLGRFSDTAAKVSGLAGMAVDLGIVISLWPRFSEALPDGSRNAWLERLDLPWIPQIGARVQLNLDGLSLLLVSLTAVLALVALGASWRSVRTRVGLFNFQVSLAVAGLAGVFLATDLLLFLLFWELMLIPTYFLIVIWGHENRQAAGAKFFLFTQMGGLLMLVAILGLYAAHGTQTGEYTFDSLRLAGTALSDRAQMLLMLGFFVAFAVKLPVFPLHPWLPDAYTEAPTSGSIMLAGLLSKTGAYGLIRFAVPLFPDASRLLSPWAAVLALIGIIYGGIAAFGQSDMKRLIGYTSISHFGFVLLGIYAGSRSALEGAVLVMVCHGITTGALFALAGSIQDRMGTRDLGSIRGLWNITPRLAGMTLFFALAAMGLPGLGNFAGEFLVLLGVFAVHVLPAVVASTALVVSVVYALGLARKTLFGSKPTTDGVVDLGVAEMLVTAGLLLIILYIGLFPQTVIGAVRPYLQTLPGGGS